MDVPTITMPKHEARKAFRDYRAAVKTRNEQKVAKKRSELSKAERAYMDEDKELMAAYRWLAHHDLPLLDIVQVVRDGGFDEKGRPLLAIARADWRRATFGQSYYHKKRGEAEDEHRDVYVFSNAEADTSAETYKQNVVLPITTVPTEALQRWGHRRMRYCEAMVPSIPPRLRPDKLENYYILWEAVWIDAPPVDPYLLKRVSDRFFAVVAQWDLTPLERAVIEGTRQARR